MAKKKKAQHSNNHQHYPYHNKVYRQGPRDTAQPAPIFPIHTLHQPMQGIFYQGWLHMLG